MLKIAVVDDDDGVRMVLVRLLASHGHHAFGFANAQEFRAACPTLQPDVLLCDIVMPGEDGIELLSRPEELCSRIHVLMSGYGEDDYLRGRELPAGVHFMPKPFVTSEVIELLQRSS